MTGSASSGLEILRMVINHVWLVVLCFSMTGYKVKRKTAVLSLLGVTFLSVLANCLYLFWWGTAHFSNVVFFTTTLPCFVLLLLLSKDNLAKNLYNLWLQTNVWCLIWLVVGFAYKAFGITLLGDILLRLVLYVVIWAIQMKYIRRPYRVLADEVKKNWVVIGIIPMLLTMVFMQGRAMHSAHGLSYLDLARGLMVVLLMVACHMVIIRTIHMVYQSMVRDELEKNMRNLLLLQKARFAAAEQQMEQEKVDRENQRSNARTVLHLIDSCDVKKARAFVEQLSLQTQSIPVDQYTENLVANLVIKNHLARAREKGLHVRYNVIIPREMFVPEMEFSVILSNILHNGVENAATYLHVKIQQEEHRLLISCENDYTGERQRDAAGHYVPVDRNKNGLGLQNVAQLVAKLGGIMDVSHENNRFSVRIVLTHGE